MTVPTRIRKLSELRDPMRMIQHLLMTEPPNVPTAARIASADLRASLRSRGVDRVRADNAVDLLITRATRYQQAAQDLHARGEAVLESLMDIRLLPRPTSDDIS